MSTFLCGIQSRSTSTRLPGKSLMTMNMSSKPLWKYSYDICSKLVKTYMLVPEDDQAQIESCYKYITPLFTGDKLNVLKRYYEFSERYSANYYIRVTGDCPLLSIYELAYMIKYVKEHKGPDYYSNRPSSIDGNDIEIFTKDILDEAFDSAESEYDLEHVTPYMRNNSLRCEYVSVKLSVDTKEDFDLIQSILKESI
jgi:spore coat polysaccharide biosynthesis protein SpsF